VCAGLRLHGVGVLAVAALVVACNGERPESRPPAKSSSTRTTPSVADEAPPRPRVDPAAVAPLRRPAAARLVAIGDLHGDLEATRHALRLAKVVDDADRWIGGTTVVVQTGDQLDRGDQERAILELLDRLAREAKAAGGALVVLNGNHEVMNVLWDFRYVTEGGYRDFADVKPDDPADPRLAEVPEPARGRAAAFAPGGPYARILAQRPIAAIVGDTAFVHGGILPEHVARLAKLDQDVRTWMSGGVDEPRAIVEAIMDEQGPVWTRFYADDGAAVCERLADALAAMDAARLVIGHTVQKGGITSACDGRLWRIDVGLATHYGGPHQVLEIVGDEARVLSGDGATADH